MPSPTTIHVWSDYVCPFCLIADAQIERATAARSDVRVEHHAYELRPHPTPTLRPEDEYLPSIWRRSVYPMARRHNVPLTLPSVSPQPYTDVAFRGSYFAAEHGKAQVYHRRMLTAFFNDDLDIGDRAVLGELAADIGLDRADYLSSLDDERNIRRHREALAEATKLRISVVPTIIIGSRRIDGVASDAAIEAALDEAQSGRVA